MGWFSKFNPFSAIVDIIKSPIEEWQKRKTIEVLEESKRQDREFEMRKLKAKNAFELAKQGIQIEADWDANAQHDMKTSWKDEYLTIIFTVPLILSFIPSMQGIVLEGFRTLNETPSWYILMVTGIVSATFGLRWLLKKGK